MQEEGFPFARVVAMSGSGQQHGSVYWKKGSEGVLGELNPTATLASQLEASALERLRHSVRVICPIDCSAVASFPGSTLPTGESLGTGLCMQCSN